MGRAVRGDLLLGPRLILGRQARLAFLVVSDAAVVSPVHVHLLEAAWRSSVASGSPSASGTFSRGRRSRSLRGIKLEAVSRRPAADAAEVIERLYFQSFYPPLGNAHDVAATPHQVDFDQMAVARQDLLLLRLVRCTARTKGLVSRAHHLDHCDQLHFAVGIEDLNPRLVDFQVFDSHISRACTPPTRPGAQDMGPCRGRDNPSRGPRSQGRLLRGFEWCNGSAISIVWKPRLKEKCASRQLLEPASFLCWADSENFPVGNIAVIVGDLVRGDVETPLALVVVLQPKRCRDRDVFRLYSLDSCDSWLNPL